MTLDDALPLLWKTEEVGKVCPALKPQLRWRPARGEVAGAAQPRACAGRCAHAQWRQVGRRACAVAAALLSTCGGPASTEGCWGIDWVPAGRIAGTHLRQTPTLNTEILKC